MTFRILCLSGFAAALTTACVADPAYRNDRYSDSSRYDNRSDRSDRYASGEWRFDADRCPDLVEDRRDRAESRRDERRDNGRADRAEDRADRRESRRDERVTECPSDAWSYYGPDNGRRAQRPAPASVYFDERDRYYYRESADGVRIRLDY